MRKAIFLNFPTHGCINSLLATVSELVDRGERIIYYCTEEFRDKIEQTGAEFRPYGGRVNQFKIENDDLSKALQLNVEMTVDKLEHNFEAIGAEAPDYIAHDSLCTWGKHMAAMLKVPVVNLMHSYPVTKASISFSKETASLLAKVGLYKLKTKWVKNSPPKVLKKKYHIDLSLADTMINREDLNIVYTSRHMEPALFQSERSFVFVGPSLFFKKEPTDFPFDRLKGQKIIYISLGTLHNDNRSFYDTCVKAFAGSAYLVVMSVGFQIDQKAFSDLPANFIIRPSVPQQILLDKVNLFITHAGMNSVNEAICAGVPMLMLPHQFEQSLVARRVAKLGIGLVLRIKKLTSKTLYEQAKKLIEDPQYINQALKYQAIFKDEEETSHLKAADEIARYVDMNYSSGMS
jgi:MGT family glycosyltransferase